MHSRRKTIAHPSSSNVDDLAWDDPSQQSTTGSTMVFDIEKGFKGMDESQQSNNENSLQSGNLIEEDPLPSRMSENKKSSSIVSLYTKEDDDEENQKYVGLYRGVIEYKSYENVVKIVFAAQSDKSIVYHFKFTEFSLVNFDFNELLIIFSLVEHDVPNYSPEHTFVFSMKEQELFNDIKELIDSMVQMSIDVDEK
ncbi:hypothetical protein QTN25_010180 [Entamoeba marina]